MSVEALVAPQPFDQRGEIVAKQGLAAGEPELADAQAREDAGEPIDFFEREDRLAGQPDVLCLRHAVTTAHVAAVGDRHAEALERAPKYVAHLIAHVDSTVTGRAAAVGSTHSMLPSL